MTFCVLEEESRAEADEDGACSTPPRYMVHSGREGASERGCPPKQLEGAEGLGTSLVMAETVKIKGRGAKGFPGQLG